MKLSIRLGLAVALAISNVPALAAPVSSVSEEASGLALMDKSAAAYAKLKGLSMRYTDTLMQDGFVTLASGTVAWDEHGWVRVSTAGGRHVMVTQAKAHGAQSLKQSLARAVTQTNAAAGAPLYLLVQGKNPLRGKAMFGTAAVLQSIRLLPDGVAATFGDPARRGQSAQMSLYLDPRDFLLRRVEVKVNAGVKGIVNLTSLSEVHINPTFSPDTFATPRSNPASGDRELSYRVPPAPAPVKAPNLDRFDPKLQVGADPFPLVGADWGKYRGQVVLLDFWATGCGPCVREIPSILVSYRKYHAQGFEIIGVSTDKDKGKLDRFVKARRLPWPQIFDGSTHSINARRYGLGAIPFTLLIGKDGKIAAVNPRGSELEPAIMAALKK